MVAGLGAWFVGGLRAKRKPPPCGRAPRRPKEMVPAPSAKTQVFQGRSRKIAVSAKPHRVKHELHAWRILFCKSLSGIVEHIGKKNGPGANCTFRII